jgi:hypothetical protein
MASVVDSAAEGVHDPSGRGRWSLKGMARRPEFGAVVATVLVYLFFAITTQGAGFVSIDGTAGWLDTAAELGIIAIPVGILMIAGEFDLSVGSIVGASAVFLAIGTTVFNVPFWFMIAVVLLGGGVRGAYQWNHHGPHWPPVIQRVARGELLRRRRRDRFGALAHEYDQHLSEPTA